MMMQTNPHDAPFPSQPVRIRLLTAGFTLLLLIVLTLLVTGGREVDADNSARSSNVTSAPTAVGLSISEFRLRGPNGANDEFIEIGNDSGAIHTVASVSGTGYAVAASDGVVRCTIPNGTTIPAGGNFLCANSAGYSLGGYPAGNGTTATPDATYTLDIPDNVGIALFNNNSGGGNFTSANRFDAVGSNAESNTLYRQGAGYPGLSLVNIEHSLHKGKRFLIFVSGPNGSSPDNAQDFMFVDPSGTSAGMSPHLGAPGPQNLSSPVFLNSSFDSLRLDATRAVSVPPNRVRDFTPDPANNSTFGTLSIRRRFVNNTGAPVTRLRFRVIDISTLPAASGDADLRVRVGAAPTVTSINDSATCAATGSPATPPCTVIAQATTLETPPAQPIGGGFNSSLSAGTVTVGTPIAPGASINLQFVFGVQAQGNYRLLIALEALPASGSLFGVSGNTTIPNSSSDALNTTADYDGDGLTDISVYRPSNATWYLLRSATGFTGVSFGQSTDRIVPADYDGDGKTDIAVYRPSTGVWILRNSNTGLSETQFGLAGDLPTPADYDGDGKADLSVFRPSNGTWYRLNSADGVFVSVQFGLPGDKPTIGDFDGDGLSDMGVYRPTNGTFYLRNTNSSGFSAVSFGLSTDVAVPGDFDGDGKTDVSVFRPSNGFWYRLNSGTGAFVAISFGLNGDIPATGDYDLDGREDISVFRPSNGTWYRLNSSNGAFFAQQFGVNGDVPTPSAFRY